MRETEDKRVLDVLNATYWETEVERMAVTVIKYGVNN